MRRICLWAANSARFQAAAERPRKEANGVGNQCHFLATPLAEPSDPTPTVNDSKRSKHAAGPLKALIKGNLFCFVSKVESKCPYFTIPADLEHISGKSAVSLCY